MNVPATGLPLYEVVAFNCVALKAAPDVIASGLDQVIKGVTLTIGMTVRVNTSLTIPPAPSSAVTRISRLPASAAVGAPVKLRAAGLKLNQAGSALPLERVDA